MPLAEALALGERAGVQRVFVAGAAQTPGVVIAEAPSGAHVFADGHYPTIARNGVSVHYLAQWFGETTEAPIGRELFAELGEHLGRLWGDPRFVLYSNPAATGVDLWARTIRGKSWPVLLPADQTAVREATGQGRIELFDRPPTISERQRVTLYEYDMRLAYLAGLRRLPIGDPHPVAEMSGAYAQGRYRVAFTAPPRLSCGILAVRHQGDRSATRWPAEGEAWATGEELSLARQWGYRCEVLEGFEWARTGDPMRLWAERLVEFHRGAAELRGAVRAIMLHTIGALHGAPRKVTGTGAEPPPEAINVRPQRGGGWSWATMKQPARPDLVHPEWTTTVWARARRRLLDNGRGVGMLHIAPGGLVAARTDAFLTVAPVDVSGEGEAPGSFRLKTRSEAVPWPADVGQLMAART